MSVLCDVNVLVALVTNRHTFHQDAVRWIERLSDNDAVVCRVAQTGLLRLLNNPAVMKDEVLDTTACWVLWRRLLEDQRFRFVTSEPKGLDAVFERFTLGKSFHPRLWTDAYLASFALAGGLTLVTFDQGFRAFSGLSTEIIDSAVR